MPYVIIIAAAVLIAGASAAVYFAAFYRGSRGDVTYKVLSGPDYDPYHDDMIALIDKAVKIPYEPVYITAKDGVKLFGRLYIQSARAPYHIQFNGYKGNGIRDFSGGLQLALKTGANVILVDQRAHGASGGRTISFGVRERYDVAAWAEYVTGIAGEDARIYLDGVSMGAATVLMAADLPLPDTVKGIIADCPYDTPFGIVSHVAGKKPGLKYVSRPFIVLGALLFGRFNIFASSPVDSVRGAKAPILIIHGTADNYVPIEMSRRIRDAAPDKVTLVEVDGAPHGLSYIKDYEKYEKAFYEFLEKTKR